MTVIPHPIASSARARPNHVALHMGGVELTYRELADRVSLRAGQLRNAGVREQNRVLLSRSRGIDWIIDAFAIGWCGAVAILAPNELTSDEWAARRETLTIDWSLADDSSDGSQRLVLTESTTRLPEPSWSFDSVRFILWTSGSTGSPKPIEITTGQWVLSAFGSALRLEHHLQDRWLSCLPFEHIGGLSILLRCFLYGTSVEIHEGFDPTAVAGALDSGNITHISLVPAMLNRVFECRKPGPFAPSLRVVLLGGAATDIDLISRCEAQSVPIALTWGMTESASQICTTFLGSALEEGIVGPPLTFSRVSVSKDRLVVDGGIVPETLVTQDLGQILPDGQIRILGRADDIITSGGKKMSPSEIERALLSHPGVSEVAVVGRADPAWGQRPVVFLPECVESLSANELSDWLTQRLSRYKVPKSWVWCDALPRTPIGKIDRQVLREWLGVFVEQPDGFQGRIELLGADGGRHIGDPHEGVLEMNDRSQVSSRTDNFVAKCDGPFAHAFDAESDAQLVAVSDHLLEGRFSVDEGKPNPAAIVASLEASKSGTEHVLKTDMGILKNTIEKENAGPIDFVESGGDGNIERHNRALSPKDT